MKKTIICLQNDFFDEVVNNPEKYQHELLMEVAYISFAYRKRIFDYIFKNLLNTSIEDLMTFKFELQSLNLYEEYKDSIIKGNDKFLKTSLVLYYEKYLKDELFKSNLEVANTIVNSDEEYTFKISNLINISQFICNDEEIIYIKRNISNIVRENLECEDEKYIESILKENFDIIDDNQKYLKDTLKYTYKR